MAWNPGSYNKFKEERFAPFGDLLSLIHIKSGLQVIDLGCGTGELTRKLADALAGSEVLGIDTSAEMLQETSNYKSTNTSFLQRSIEEAVILRTQYDLVFSHAAIQWVDDHQHLIPQLVSLVNKGGQIAIQLPSNHDHYTHKAIKSVAAGEPFRSALQGWVRTAPVLAVEEYAQLLFDNGGSEITVYEKVYPHVLKDANALAEWTMGTALVPYMERLPTPLHEQFVNNYKDKLKQKFPGRHVFYPFKRILMAAVFK